MKSKLTEFVLFSLLAIMLLPIVSAQATVSITPYPYSYEISAGENISIKIVPGAEGVGNSVNIEKNGIKVASLGTMCAESKCFSEKEFIFYVPSDWQGTYSVSYTEYINEAGNIVARPAKSDFTVIPYVKPTEEAVKKAMVTPAAILIEEGQPGKRYVKSVCAFVRVSDAFTTETKTGWRELSEIVSKEGEECGDCPNCHPKFVRCEIENGGKTRRAICRSKLLFSSGDEKPGDWVTKEVSEWKCGSSCPFGWEYANNCDVRNSAFWGGLPYDIILVGDRTVNMQGKLLLQGDIFDGLRDLVTDIGWGGIIGGIVGGVLGFIAGGPAGILPGMQSGALLGMQIAGWGSVICQVVTPILTGQRMSLREFAVDNIIAPLVGFIMSPFGHHDDWCQATTDLFAGVEDNVLEDAVYEIERKPQCTGYTAYYDSINNVDTLEASGVTECKETPLYAESPSCGGEETGMSGKVIEEKVCYWQLENVNDYALLFKVGEEVRTPAGTFKLDSVDTNGKAVIKGPKDFTFTNNGIASLYSSINELDCNILRKTETQKTADSSVELSTYYAVHCTNPSIEFRYVKVMLK